MPRTLFPVARRSVIIVTVAVVAFSAAVLLFVASIGGFDPSKRVISDPVEGTETQAVENPALPEYPAFPPPTGSAQSNATSNSTDR